MGPLQGLCSQSGELQMEGGVVEEFFDGGVGNRVWLLSWITQATRREIAL